MVLFYVFHYLHTFGIGRDHGSVIDFALLICSTISILFHSWLSILSMRRSLVVSLFRIYHCIFHRSCKWLIKSSRVNFCRRMPRYSAGTGGRLRAREDSV